MVIHYNQEKDIELKENTTLKEFLESKGLNKDGVAVAVDEKIIKKVDFDSFVLKDGMAVDVYNMVSGG
ncbi:MAG: sulfur carrier protein ThiS [Succinatimonas sp.]|jgi:sulfur carrier protein|nr:sulfur carrier protein ThiS [Succinatimonas sp.]MDD5868465.1 sulfur carrier protein ThiS [Succinatimonas sp.]MDY5721732.1 sulfur carrier protein ThiS [Succinivibrio sp.]